MLNGLEKHDLRVSEPGSRAACFLLSQTRFSRECRRYGSVWRRLAKSAWRSLAQDSLQEIRACSQPKEPGS